MNSHEEDRIFEVLLEFLRRSRGFDFSGYKRSTLERRIRKRMQSHNIKSFGDYLDYLEVYPEEFISLFNTILINVTSFLRDKEAWEYVQQSVIPDLLRHKSSQEPIRIWSAGCSSGQEAYTLAMILVEILGFKEVRSRVKIYATDIDEEALQQARRASYSEKEISGVPGEWRDRYFEKTGDFYVFHPDLRRVVILGRHDLLQDAPISRLDLLLCRNALMYFNAEAQARILARFHFALKNTGTLFLGKAEMLLTQSHLFTPINLQHRIFSKVIGNSSREPLLGRTGNAEEVVAKDTEKHIRLQESVFNSLSLSVMLVDINGKLIFANLQARSMFNLKLQDLGRPLQDLEIYYRPLELRAPIDAVYKGCSSAFIRDVNRILPDGSIQYLDIKITPLLENDTSVIGISITFTDVSSYYSLQEQLHRSTQELETANEELQSSNEELHSTNEELETINEELHSTNEELETMNEELHSTNEELQTINDELRLRTSDLNQTNALLHSILASLHTAVIVVNHQFQILSWNQEAENQWGLRRDEVKGQLLLGLDIGLPVEQLRDSIRYCLAGEERQEIQLEAINRRGRLMECRVSFNPLKNFEREIWGVILLIEEINH